MSPFSVIISPFLIVVVASFTSTAQGILASLALIAKWQSTPPYSVTMPDACDTFILPKTSASKYLVTRISAFLNFFASSTEFTTQALALTFPKLAPTPCIIFL